MARPAKKRKTQTSDNSDDDANDAGAADGIPEVSVTAASDAEKRNWQGFCEIESEPAIFNVMLREFGVQGVKAQEVLGLDEELLAMLPRPVYGLIFLFRFKSEDSLPQEATCPDHIWFANQTSDFACATVALLNIVNNIPGIQLSEPLQQFKEFTQPFTPAMRGDQIGNFEFVKQIHNSFARKMDMLNIDLGMKYAATDKRLKKRSGVDNDTPSKRSKVGSAKKKTVIDESDYEDDSAFHFIAYVPIDGEIWHLDGLNRQPAKLGIAPPEDWLGVVAPVLETKMAEYEEGQIEFGLMSLVKDPLLSLREELAQNIKSVAAIDAFLATSLGNANDKQPRQQDVAADAQDDDICIPNAIMDSVEITEKVRAALERKDTAELMQLQEQLQLNQSGLRAGIRDELASMRADDERARDRRFDYGALINCWLTMLADKGVVRDLIEFTS